MSVFSVQRSTQREKPRPRPTLHTIHTLAFLCCGGWLWLLPEVAQGHALKQTRVIHVAHHGPYLELYLNLMLPGHSRSALWQKLFDRNRDGRLSPPEQKKLGHYLAKRYLTTMAVRYRQRAYSFRLQRLQNSKLRGDRRRGRYSWDYRFRAGPIVWGRGPQQFQFQIPPLQRREKIPMALFSLTGATLQRTRTSYLLTRPGRTHAVCTLQHPNALCLFRLTIVPPVATSTRPTSRPSTKLTPHPPSR